MSKYHYDFDKSTQNYRLFQNGEVVFTCSTMLALVNHLRENGIRNCKR